MDRQWNDISLIPSQKKHGHLHTFETPKIYNSEEEEMNDKVQRNRKKTKRQKEREEREIGIL